jgi:hypothetical protein
MMGFASALPILRATLAAVEIVENLTWKHNFLRWSDIMLGIEKRYVERTARTKSRSFVNRVIIYNLAVAPVFLFFAFESWTDSKSPADIFFAILFSAGFLGGLRLFYLVWRAAKRQKELNIR